MKQPDACTVRITDAQGKILGTGFLVSTDGLIVTCAHVVRVAEPRVAFPGGEFRPTQVVAADEIHDVAVLRVEGALPPDAAPARLGRSTDAYHRDFWSRGYRPTGGLEGIPAEGKVLDAVSEAPGYQGVRHMPLVLQTQHVRGGMSGAPVYVSDLDLVVGMITGHWDSLINKTGFSDRDTALATSAEAIAALWPDIPLCEPRPASTRRPFVVPFQAPAVPRYFVPRPEITDDLKALLLAEEAAAPGALVVSAVHGLGGIGKTTLVAALAHDPDVQARFSDGVLWATLGQQPETLSRLHEWIQASRDYDFHPTTVDGASAHLRTLLHDESCLLVVDDAWQAESVRPFLVGGERCRVLVTTRDAALARKVGARLYDLDVMTEAQALALFQARLGPLDGNRVQAAALAGELGHLPLALELAAAQVEGGSSWNELLKAFRRELADLRALDLDEATYRNESLCLSFRLSLEQLSPEDQEAFAWLGVLPEDARLNPAMVATLWDQPEAEGRKRLRRLRDRALLKAVRDEQYTVHDLLHVEAGQWLAARMPLPEAHATLLTRYRAQTRGGLWHTLPDDGYIHERLAWHMEKAGQPEATHALLREETAEGWNGWHEARERLGQTAGYLGDVRRAWQLAENKFALRFSPFAVGLQCRYAVATASINSLARNIPPELLVALVDKGIWTPLQGLAYARQIPKPEQRTEALTGLAPYLPEGERDETLREVLAAVREIGGESDRAKALAGLARYLPKRLLPEVLAAAQEIRDRRTQAEALAGLAPHLPEGERDEMLREVLEGVREIWDEGDRAETLARLAPHLPEELLREALAAVRAISDRRARAEVLAALALHLPEGERDKTLGEALAAAREIGDEWWRAKALAGLASHLPEPLLSPALAAAWKIRDISVQAEVLTGLTSHLAELGWPEEALAAARKIEDRRARAEALAGLASHLPEGERDETLWEALAAARAIGDERWRAKALAGLAPYLPEGLLREALAAARAIGDRKARAEVLAGLASHLPEGERGEILREALAGTREIWDERDRAEALTVLISHSPEGLLREALAAMCQIESERVRGEALAGLAPHLPEGLLRDVLAATWQIESERVRVEALAGLAPHLPEGLLREALAGTREIGDEEDRVEALAGLALHLTELDCPEEALAAAHEIADEWWRTETLARLASRLAELGYPDKALAAAQEIRDRRVGAQALAGLAPYLPEGLLREVLAAARAISDRGVRAEVLAGLAPHLPEGERDETLREALAAARQIGDERWRAKALAGLAPHLPEPLLRRALTAARKIRARRARAEAQARLTSHLAELGWPEEALAAARKIKDRRARAEALAGLVPYLPKGLSREALAAAWKISDGRARAEALAELAQQLAGRERDEILWEALAAARRIKDRRARAEVLAGLAPQLSEPLLREVLAAAREIRDRRAQAEALTGLAPYLSEPLRDETLREALVAARQIGDTKARAEALAGLAPHLPEELLREALAATWAISDRRARAEVLAALAPHLPVGERDEILREALAAVRKISDGRARAKALAELATHLPEPLLSQALAAAREIGDERWRMEALAALAPRLAALPPAILYPLWQETLHVLATRTRQDLLADIPIFSPIIAALGGEEAIAETFHAIQDVGRWWP